MDVRKHVNMEESRQLDRGREFCWSPVGEEELECYST